MPPKRLFLICNAHLDPVWLWTWTEGLSETLATFRTAARLCEEFPEFVFCHNEAVLYRWVEEYEPDLFERIRRLVGEGRWHIMGGWHLQPDCNLPSGESFVRQILYGKRWFLEKFGVEPRTAVNFDPFGHSRGLVQILKKGGYHSYLFCRPDPASLSLPSEDFIWVGYDGSEIAAHRAPEHYNSEFGKARVKLETWLKKNAVLGTGMLLWGIGDHGGGPSREDLSELREVIQTESARSIRHGTPEEYFEALADRGPTRPRYSRDLNPWAVGCYTSMARIKHRHRALEARALRAEKISAHADAAGLAAYPRDRIGEAFQDLLYCQFHDILPGSSIAEVEAEALRRMDHALEILDRIHTRAFFALTSGHAAAGPGEFPILVYNPHPFPVVETLVCEFQPPEPFRDRNAWHRPVVTDEHGGTVPHQAEKESCNIAVDQRKRVVFRAELPPGRMSRFPCRLNRVEEAPAPAQSLSDSTMFVSETGETVVDPGTGLIRRYTVGGIDFLRPGAARLLVIRDDPDPWGMKVSGFRDVLDEFRLMAPAESAEFAGVDRCDLAPVRIIERGEVRMVVEALFVSGRSTACLRYKIPRLGSELELEIRVYWSEKDRMLKLALPTAFREGTCRGQVVCGREAFKPSEDERIAQQWLAVLSPDETSAMTVINDGTYGFDFHDGELRISLLRSAGYAAHPVADDLPIMRQDRFEPRIDQGERVFRFWIRGGEAEERLERIEREAQVKHEPPTALCCSPAGGGGRPRPLVEFDGEAAVLTACKPAEQDDRIVLRLFEPTGKGRKVTVRLPLLNLEFPVALDPFELKTLAVDPRSREVTETDLLERPAGGAK